MINTNNFFKRNISIRNPAVPYKKGKFIDQSAEYKSRVFSRVQESPLTKTLLSMRKNVLGIENALRGLFELDKKKQTTDQKFDLAEKQEAKDKPKVKPKTPKIFGNIVERPKTGIIDAVKNFVTFTFLGWLFTRLQPFIDKAGGLVPLLENIMKFFSGLIVGTLNAFASFLKFGYDVKDTFDLKIKEIKKEAEGISKHFDNTLGELKTVFSGAIEIVNSFLNTSVDGGELKTARQDAPKDSPETNIPPLPKLPDVATVSPSSSAASNISRDSPTGKTSPQSTPISTTSPTIYKVNTGGRIDPTKTPITRVTEQKEKRVIRRKPDIQQQKTVPGKDVGGEDKVKEVYGEETGTFKSDLIPNSIFFRTETKSGYAGLLKAAEEYKRPNDRDILGLGNLMGATVDTALGQKLERRTITQFADGIKYLVEQGMSNPEEFKKIDLELMLRRIIEPKIEAAINKIRDEVNKKSKEKPTDGGLDGGGLDGGAVSGNEYERAFLDLLAHAEGTTGSYGTVFGGAVNSDLASGNLTVQEAISFSNNSVGGSGVIGRYQFKATTLQGLVRNGVLSLNEKFTPEKQDQAAIALARGRGVDPSKPLTIGDMYRLGGEWASIEGGLQMTKGGSYGWKGRSQVKYTAEKALKKYNELLESVKVNFTTNAGSHAKARYLIVMSGSKGYRQVTPGESAPMDFLHHGREDIRRGLIVRDYGITPQVHGGSQLLEGEGAPLIVPFGLRARAVVEGRHFIRFEDPLTKRIIARYHHVDNIPSNINGKILSGGTFFGTQGGRPGSSSGYGGSTAVHTHLEGTPEWHRAFISTYAGGLNINKTNSPKQKPTPQRQQTPKQPEIQRITQTPPGEPYLIKGKMYYVDLKNNKVFTINEKGDRVEVKVGPGQNEWLLKEIYKMRQLRQNQKISFSKIPPTTPAEKYASYNQPDSQKPSYIQPIIIKELVPVSTGSGSIIAFAPPSISNDKSQSLSRG
jgi:hypothetical protein